MGLTAPAAVSPEHRDAFYAAAVSCLRALDARERLPRRVGPNANAYQASIYDAPVSADRIDLLLRDAAVTWCAVFSAAEFFDLFGLAPDKPAPGSLADWERIPIGRKSETEAQRRLHVLVVLGAFPDGRPDRSLPAARSVPEVAESMDVEPAHIHSSLQLLRSRRWADNDVVQALVDSLRPMLVEPAMPLLDLERALAESRCGSAPGAGAHSTAAALVRVALELRPQPLAAWRRLESGPWLARDPAVLDALADAADRLAALEPLASTETVRQVLANIAEGAPLSACPQDQRVLLAAQASRNAAASARMALYPRGMDAGRVLVLSLSVRSGGGFSPEVLRRRVATRYPKARPLPDLPDLDRMLAPHGLVYVPDLSEYLRPGQHAPRSMTVQLPPRAPTAGPGLPPRREPDAQRAATFQDQLDRGMVCACIRVVSVRAGLAVAAAERLGEAVRVTPVSLDHALAAAMRACVAADEVDWATIEAADRTGPEGPGWPLLVGLVRDAADAMMDQLLSRRAGPLVLVWPGALARYPLSGALTSLGERAEVRRRGHRAAGRALARRRASAVDLRPAAGACSPAGTAAADARALADQRPSGGGGSMMLLYRATGAA